MFRVIVAGSRDFKDYQLLEKTLDYFLQNINEPIHILCGMANGADALGLLYAHWHDCELEKYPAKWDIHGKRAGFIRNEEMAQNADALVAFWDGKSHGTKDMIKRAREHGLHVKVVRYGDKNDN